jgi:hypothetical protein
VTFVGVPVQLGLRIRFRKAPRRPSGGDRRNRTRRGLDAPRPALDRADEEGGDDADAGADRLLGATSPLSRGRGITTPIDAVASGSANDAVHDMLSAASARLRLRRFLLDVKRPSVARKLHAMEM